MGIFKEYDIGNNYNVVLDIGTLLSSDHLCKQIETIVSELDTSTLDSTYSRLGQGQNALHPKLMLSIHSFSVP